MRKLVSKMQPLSDIRKRLFFYGTIIFLFGSYYLEYGRLFKKNPAPYYRHGAGKNKHTMRKLGQM
jgi:hypothetical protein